MSVRRSARKNKGQSPSRLGSADGWADVAPSKWGGVDHKEVEYDEDASYSEHDDDEDLSGAAEPEEASGETKVQNPFRECFAAGADLTTERLMAPLKSQLSFFLAVRTGRYA